MGKSRKEYNRNYYRDNRERLNKNARDRRRKPGSRVYKKEIERYEKQPERFKHLYLLRMYGITYDDYNLMFVSQQGCCAICGVHQSELKQSLCVDHNHETKKVRGLLCKKCNTGLGNFKDSLEILNKAQEFLINKDK